MKININNEIYQNIYVYRLRTPLGSSEHLGLGDTVAWPKSLLRRCWIWKLFNAYISIDRRKLGSKSWTRCFWWPARKLSDLENYPI